MTTREDIARMVDRAETKHTHMIVVCDTFDHSDYPVFVSEDENVKDVIKKFDGPNMQRVIEVYNLNIDIAEQVAAGRVYNL